MGGPDSDSAWGIAATDDGGCLVAGVRDQVSGTAKATLVRLDAAGDTLWTRVYAPAPLTAFLSVLQTPDRGFLAAGPYQVAPSPRLGYLVRVDSLGGTVWSKTFGGPYGTFVQRMRFANDGNVVLVGHEATATPGVRQIFLLAIDAAGDTLWVEHFGAADVERGFDVLQLADDSWIFCGDTAPIGGTPLALAVGLTPSRTVAWVDTLGAPGYAAFRGVVDAGGGDVVLGGYFHVADTPLDDDIYAAKVDAQDGSVVWERRYGSTNDQAGWSCVPHSPGRHLLIGNTQAAGSGNYDALALLIDTDGDSIVVRTYGNASDHETFYFGQAAAGGGFVATGSTGLFGGGDLLAVADTLPPVAAFTASPRSGPAPLSVDFTDRSTFTASSWEWDFDDDGTPDAYTQNPTHVYTEPGAYTVVLTASAASGSRTRAKTRYVRVSCPAIQVSSSALNLPCAAGATTLEVQDLCGEPLDWAADESETWLRLVRGIFFDDFDSGGPDAQWTSVPGEWGVSAGRYRSTTYSGQPSFVDTVLADCSASTSIGPLASGEAGVVVRAQGPSHFVLLRFNAATLEAFWQVVDGFYGVPINTVAGAFTSGSTHTVKVVATGNRFDAYLDGASNPLTSYVHNDTTFAVGKVGVWSIGAPESVASFDDFTIDTDSTHLIVVHDELAGSPARAGVITIASSGASNTPVLLPVDQGPDCPSVDFGAVPTSGVAPLAVQFTNLCTGGPSGWSWDFDGDGAYDSNASDPLHVYDEPGIYSVMLRASFATGFTDSLSKPGFVAVLARDSLTIASVHVLSSGPFPIPIHFSGVDSLGAISLYFNFDDTKLSFSGIQSHVPGESFSAGIVSGRVSVQWIDDSGGFDPILPGSFDLFSLMFTSTGSYLDSTAVSFERIQLQSVLGNPVGDPIASVLWRDQPPFGQVVIDVHATVSGRVGYYWLDKNVPGAVLSMGSPNPDVSTDSLGAYQFDPYPVGNYVLGITKSTDLLGINSLDAIKVVRHSSGIEPFGDPNKVTAANVNNDGFVNALDAIKIVRGAAGLEALASGNWKFLPASASFVPLDTDRTQDFVAIRMGDVNGDWEPDAGAFPVLAAAATHPGSRIGPDSGPQPAAAALVDTIRVVLPDTTIDAGASAVSLPVRVEAFNGIGALSLRIVFADSVLSYVNLSSQVEGTTFTSNLIGNEIRIEWFDATGGSSPLNVGNGVLLLLNFSVAGTAGDSTLLRFTPQSSLGDATGDPLPGARFVSGRLQLLGPPVGTLADEGEALSGALDCRPNPFRASTWVHFSLPSPQSPVRLRIYDARGRLVRDLHDRITGAARQKLLWDGRDEAGLRVAPGVYFVKLETGGTRSTRKLLRLQ